MKKQIASRTQTKPTRYSLLTFRTSVQVSSILANFLANSTPGWSKGFIFNSRPKSAVLCSYNDIKEPSFTTRTFERIAGLQTGLAIRV